MGSSPVHLGRGCRGKRKWPQVGRDLSHVRRSWETCEGAHRGLLRPRGLALQKSLCPFRLKGGIIKHTMDFRKIFTPTKSSCSLPKVKVKKQWLVRKYPKEENSPGPRRLPALKVMFSCVHALSPTRRLHTWSLIPQWLSRRGRQVALTSTLVPG